MDTSKQTSHESNSSMYEPNLSRKHEILNKEAKALLSICKLLQKTYKVSLNQAGKRAIYALERNWDEETDLNIKEHMLRVARDRIMELANDPSSKLYKFLNNENTSKEIKSAFGLKSDVPEVSDITDDTADKIKSVLKPETVGEDDTTLSCIPIGPLSSAKLTKPLSPKKKLLVKDGGQLEIPT